MFECDDDLWEKVSEYMRSQGEDPEDLLRRAARNIQLYHGKPGTEEDEKEWLEDVFNTPELSRTIKGLDYSDLNTTLDKIKTVVSGKKVPDA